MIYLRHAFATSGFAAPTMVAVAVDDVDWLVAQVLAEMHALFPDAQVHRVGDQPSQHDLLVVVYAAGTRPEEQLERLASRARQARTGAAFYCVDDRHLDLVRTGDLDRWEKGQRRRRAVLSWSRRLPFVWNRVVRRFVAS
jgi:hypothetical protein